MSELKLRFHFTSTAVAEDTFLVISFTGEESLSQPFHFEIMLLSKKGSLDTAMLLQEPAIFTISGEKGVTPINGVLASCSETQKLGQFTVYKVSLVPKLWRLSQTRHNQIFLDKNVQQFLEAVLKDGGLEPDLDYVFKLQKTYPPRDYVCQYNESHLDFISRWTEHYGLYYYFDQSKEGRLVITDTAIAHTSLPRADTLRYVTPSGMEDTHGEEVVSSFNLLQAPVPQQVGVRDWNYRTPNAPVQGMARVDAQGRGAINYYNEHCRTDSESKELATIRSQEFLCRQQLFNGISGIPYLVSGFTFTLDNHFRSDFNQDYLLQRVHHRGSQKAYLISLIQASEEQENEILYSNAFTAIPAGLQFRPQRITPWPRFSGVMNATIDAEGSGQYAEVDEQGRYKVILPFDRSGRKDGHASSWLRMAQPYGGADHGLHFPLHKGTEVILACVDGNPDRPIVLGSVPNPEKPSPVVSTNQTMCHIRTSGQNHIKFSDTDGKQHVVLHCEAHDTYWRMGYPNDPDSNSPIPSGMGWTPPDPTSGANSSGGDDTTTTTPPATSTTSSGEGKGDKDKDDKDDKDEKEEKSGFVGHKLYTSKALTIKAGSANTVIFGNSSESFLGLDVTTYLIFNHTFILGTEIGLNLAMTQSIKPIHNRWKETEETMRAAEEKEAEQASKLVETMEALKGTITGLSEEVTELAEENTHLLGEKVTVAEEKTHLAEEYIEVAETTTGLYNDRINICQENSKLCQQITELQNTNTSIVESTNSVCDNITELAAEISTLCEEQTAMMDELAYVSASVNHLAAFVTTT